MPVEGILPVIPTPFLDGAFDAASFERLLEHMLPGVDGYTLLGSTGEAPSLTGQERRRIAELALAMTPAQMRVVVGVTSTSASETAELARHAQEHGAAAVLCAAPFYFANTPDGILRHLTVLDAALSIDLVVYDNPVATKTKIAADDVVRWAGELEHLTAVKLTDHELAKVQVWQQAGLTVLAGDDPIALRYLAAGVDGAMVIAPAVFPEAFREVWTLIRAGSVADALALAGQRILPFLHVFGIGDEIATTKALLKEIGVFASDELLAPLVQVTPERRRLLRDAYDACQRAPAESSAGQGT
jgi:4-hydroxy-tetrahydrodipicolinate synthase